MVEIVKGGADKIKHRSERFNWPFKEMEVDDLVVYRPSDKGADRAQRMAHTYGGLFGRKFATRKIDGDLNIWRVA